MLILTGASASGKTATALNLEQRHGFSKAITTTTRAIRQNEVDGKDYFFLTVEEFNKRLQEGKFVESSLYNGNYYGCGIDQVSDNKVIVLDPNGVKSFQALNDKNIIVVLLKASEETRSNRMNSRGDKKDKIAERLSNDVTSFSSDKYENIDLVICTDNKSIDEVSDEINSFYRSHLI